MFKKEWDEIEDPTKLWSRQRRFDNFVSLKFRFFERKKRAPRSGQMHVSPVRGENFVERISAFFEIRIFQKFLREFCSKIFQICVHFRGEIFVRRDVQPDFFAGKIEIQQRDFFTKIFAERT